MELRIHSAPRGVESYDHMSEPIMVLRKLQLLYVSDVPLAYISLEASTQTLRIRTITSIESACVECIGDQSRSIFFVITPLKVVQVLERNRCHLKALDSP